MLFFSKPKAVFSSLGQDSEDDAERDGMLEKTEYADESAGANEGRPARRLDRPARLAREVEVQRVELTTRAEHIVANQDEAVVVRAGPRGHDATWQD